jgi:hypothetical protein
MSNLKNKLGPDLYKPILNFKSFFGIQNVDALLPQDMEKPKVLLLEGQLNTFKTTLAMNYLYGGLFDNENVLLLRLGNERMFNPNSNKKINLSQDIYKSFFYKIIQNENDKMSIKEFLEKGKFENCGDFIDDLCELNIKNINQEIVNFFTFKHCQILNHIFVKYYIQNSEIIDIFNRDAKKYNINTFSTKDNGIFCEIDFKSGYLLPEEIVQIFRETHLFIKNKTHGDGISRIVFSDVGLIGINYPFLKKSRTAGELFLTAFIHIIKNYNMNMVMVGTTGKHSGSEESVNRARALSDAVIKCDIKEIYGDRYITLTGLGITSGERISDENLLDNRDKSNTMQNTIEYNEIASEVIPAVILLQKDQPIFEIDLNRLRGLVGFESGEIRRPGLMIYLFEEGYLHREYNKEIDLMLKCTFAQPQYSLKGHIQYNEVSNQQNVSIVPFDSSVSQTIHDSFGLLEGSPIDKTVIYTVDEFFHIKSESQETQRPIFAELKYNKPLVKYQKRYIKAFNERGEKQLKFARPYYANVLMLAYFDKGRKKIKKINEKDHNKINNNIRKWKNWKQIQKYINQPDEDSEPLFDYGRRAPETLSCVLMDLLHDFFWGKAMHNSDKIIRYSELNEEFKHIIDNVEFEQNLEAFYKLFHKSWVYWKKREITEKELEIKKGEDYNIKKEFYEKACVLLCWYSEFREFVNRYADHANNFNISSLPNLGYRGDWYIGVLKGSVSNELGNEVINILCKKNEEYKRLAKGVGIPTLESFYDSNSCNGPDFFAWPGALNVSLKKVANIHREARERSVIIGYENYRSALTMIAEQIISMPTYDTNDAISVLNRIPEQIKMLTIDLM